VLSPAALLYSKHRVYRKIESQKGVLNLLVGQALAFIMQVRTYYSHCYPLKSILYRNIFYLLYHILFFTV
jgi:hypothetical protein